MATKIESSMEYSKSFPKSVCTCGHSGDGAHSFHAGLNGHGRCTHVGVGSGTRCECGQFSWSGWTKHFTTFLDKKADVNEIRRGL